MSFSGKPEGRRFTAATLLAFGAVTLVYLSVVLTLAALDENRGVVDDICYLRQAQLFREKRLIAGLDTDSADGRYLAAKYKTLNFPPTFTPFVPCESLSQSTGHVRLQYPFATGLLLSFFPSNAASSGLYIASATLVLVLACGAILTSASIGSLIPMAVLGTANVYMMVNPSKSSYSIAPTMPVCIIIGFLTVWMFAAQRARHRIVSAAAAGFLVGVATGLRLSSALLAFGFALVFLAQFIHRRSLENFLRPAVFGGCCILALIPLFVSNALNGGGIFATAYGGQDTQLPDLSLQDIWAMAKWYGLHTHGLLFWIAAGCLGLLIVKHEAIKLRGGGRLGCRRFSRQSDLQYRLLPDASGALAVLHDPSMHAHDLDRRVRLARIGTQPRARGEGRKEGGP